MKLINPEHWAIWVACSLMLLVTVIFLQTNRVPNALTFPVVLGGWFTALLISQSSVLPSAGGSILASLAAAFLGGLMLMPVYSWGLGAGSVKMQAGFGAWVGCAVDVIEAIGITLIATTVGLVITGVAYQIAKSRLPESDIENETKRYFPAQITLSLGTFIGVLGYFFLEPILGKT